MSKKLVCDCNRTMPLDGKGLGLDIHTSLCRQEVGTFLKALEDSDSLVIACTQEQALFRELAASSNKSLVAPLRFVNIREVAGWTQDAKKSTPKISALLALAEVPEAEPVPAIEYQSQGRLLIIGPADQALPWAERLGESLDVSVLCTESGSLPLQRSYPIYSGMVTRLDGFLGRFSVDWNLQNPIDPEMCTRCGACVEVCPEKAIDDSFQINLLKCKSHRSCEAACSGIGAINFNRVENKRSAEFDLVMDLRLDPSMRMTQYPQGYFNPKSDPFEQSLVAGKLLGMVGDFEKPKYFSYNDKVCAHGRNGVIGCNLCIEVCSTGAIGSIFKDGSGRIEVNPNLCMGCGTCSTVCPSGAIRYNYPSTSHQSKQLKVMLNAYNAGLAKVGNKGSSPTLLIHSLEVGAGLIEGLGRSAHLHPERFESLPAFVLPFGIEHIGSTGIEFWLTALSYGFGEIILLLSGEEDPAYAKALETQSELSNAILKAYGITQMRINLIKDCAECSFSTISREMLNLRKRGPLLEVMPQATFAMGNQKRENLEAALDHLQKHAKTPIPHDGVLLPKSSLLGALAINKDACTLCMSCVGSCPEGALLDSLDEPKLTFIEKQCVQCGLCVDTCPEKAISLMPRLLSVEQRKQKTVLNEAEPFHCVSCGKAFGTLKMVELMIDRLGAHNMFSGSASNRLKMCSDCRVVDMMNKDL